MASFSTPFDELASQTWASIVDAERAVMTAAEQAGFGVRRRRSGNNDHNNQPTLISYCCTRGGAKKAYVSKTSKATSSANCNCPWSAALAYTRPRKPSSPYARRGERAWRFRIVRQRDQHNHPPSDLPTAIPANRRRAREAFEHEILSLSSNSNLSATDVAEMLMDKYPGTIVTASDVLNTRRRQRQQSPASGKEASLSTGPPGKDNDDELTQRYLAMSEAQRASAESELEHQLAVLRRVRAGEQNYNSKASE